MKFGTSPAPSKDLTHDLFHIAAWQLPFIVAMTLGYHQQAFMRWFSSPRVSVATFGAASIIFALLVYLVVVPTPLQAWVEALSQKQAEGPVRLLACLFVLSMMILCPQPSQGQRKGRSLVSPEVHGDGKVTFRLVAPQSGTHRPEQPGSAVRLSQETPRLLTG